MAALPSTSSEGGPCESIRYGHWYLVGNIKTCIKKSTTIDSPDFLITSARYLEASKCSIKRIAKENFEGLSKVRILYLSHNLIETIDDDTFDHLRAVERIHLGELLMKLSSINSVIEHRLQQAQATQRFRLRSLQKIEATSLER